MTRPHSIGIIQARLSSSRLPGKILFPLNGQPLLRILIERLRPSRVQEWWLATSDQAPDDLTAAWGSALGLHVYRGSLDDVLSRFTNILEKRRPRWVVRVTADDPFMHAEIVDLLLAAAEETRGADVIGPPSPGFPLGFLPQVARAEAVLRAARDILAADSHHRSHVLSWLYQTQRFESFPLPAPTGGGPLIPLKTTTWPRRHSPCSERGLGR
jgi:spore coat polysaccharide biosynthesis protein SpsF